MNRLESLSLLFVLQDRELSAEYAKQSPQRHRRELLNEITIVYSSVIDLAAIV